MRVIKIGLSSFALRWAFHAGMSLEAFLARAADLGAEVVQLCENSGVDRLDDQALEDLAAGARRLDLALECGGTGGDIAGMERGIRRTARLGGAVYRCVVDSDGLAPEAVLDHLRQLVPLLHECGVTLCLENHFLFSPQTLGGMVRCLDDPAVRICLDPLNSIALWTGPRETIRELAPWAHTAHVKDARIKRSGGGWLISGAPLGEGDIDLPGYLAAIAPRVKSVLLESWMDPIDGEGGARTLEQESIWARNGLAVIRGIYSQTKSLLEEA